jgi:LysR family nitrogen assimilation transcriptional regulator
MDLKQLGFFVRVAELGSFMKASDLLGIAQPTLSRQIRALEIELKTSLFQRHGRGVLLTPAGARFAEEARGLLHAADTAVLSLQTGDRRLAGRVVCGLTPSVGALMISEYVQRFSKALPDASLSVVNHLSMPLHDQVKATRLDFAIFHNPPPSPGLSVTPLGSQPLYLLGAKAVGRKKNSVTFAELDGLPLIMSSRLHALRGVIELEAARLEIALNIAWEVDVMESIFELIKAGVGYTVGTRFALLGRWGSSGLTAQRICDPDLFTHIALVTPSSRALTPLQRAAADLAVATYKELTARKPGNTSLSH